MKKITSLIAAAFLLMPIAAFADSTVTATSDANSSVTPSGVTVVPTNVTQTFSISADSGYQIADVQLDGSSVGAPSSVDFTGIDGDTVYHTLDVSSDLIPVAAPVAGAGLPFCSGPMAPGWNVGLPGGGCGGSTLMFEPYSSGLCPFIDQQGCMVNK